MLEMTRLNRTTFYLNPDLIISVEAMPDTVVTLTTGEKFIVQETPQEITARFIAFKRAITQGAWTATPETASISAKA